MLSDERLEAMAASVAPEGAVPRVAEELREGRVFHFHWPEQTLPAAGVAGVIVNKRTGKTLVLGSLGMEEDIAVYDAGFQFEWYDLVLTQVTDMEATLDVLERIGPTTVEPTYEAGTVWRIPRPLARQELRQRLQTMPCVIARVQLPGAAGAQVIQQAAKQGVLEYLALECPAYVTGRG